MADEFRHQGRGAAMAHPNGSTRTQSAGVSPMTTSETGGKPSRRGFAAMDPERRREIARRGGASVPSDKRSFAQDRDLAANAGRKGGAASRGGGRRPTRTPTA